ncbi:MAG: ISKra4 family transposase [Gammaproteobacteria bacterium]|nr:ISKra4 family transposase [Gammaproteobacteria bacterium]
MTFNSQEIIQEIHKDFEDMLEYVTGEQARTATADATERGLFKMLMQMGSKLLRLFFILRSQATSREPLKTADGDEWSYHREMQRTYFSIFGKVCFVRPYFYRKGEGGRTRLDEELSLGEDCYSDLVREIHDYLSVYGVYHKACAILERVLGLRLSTRVVQTNLGEDAAEVEAYYAQKPAPPAEREADILVIQADGKGVPMILENTASERVRLRKGEKHGRKKEAVVTTVYTIEAFVRTPEQVIASYYDNIHTSQAPQPKNKHLWATLDGKEVALGRLATQVNARLGAPLRHKIALCDGCEALQRRIAKQFPDFILILDFIHANEYLWKVANALFGEGNDQRFEWMKARSLQLLSGQTKQLIAELRSQANQPKMRMAKRTQLLKTANYFERNLPFMNYPVYLSKGWPIASGVIEGACRHFVKDRCELSGMRWLQTGAENLLRLRAVAENDDWEDYHLYRKQQRHLRLYGTRKNCPVPIESQSLNLHSESVEPMVANRQNRYSQFPLAS